MGQVLTLPLQVPHGYTSDDAGFMGAAQVIAGVITAICLAVRTSFCVSVLCVPRTDKLRDFFSPSLTGSLSAGWRLP